MYIGKYSGIFPFATRLLSLNHKTQQASRNAQSVGVSYSRIRATLVHMALLGGHRRGYQPGSIHLNDMNCFGSESGAQQSNDTLVEMLEDGRQIPKGNL